MILRASTLQTHLLTIEGSCLFKVPPQGIKQKNLNVLDYIVGLHDVS